MNNYEVTFIVDPVLSGDEIKTTAQTYVDQLTSAGCTIVHVDEMGLRPLAYPINRRSSGVYFCVEFSNINGEFMDNLELSLRRDERIMRFLTVKLDKYGVKYNEDKRNGLIGKRKKKTAEPAREESVSPKEAVRETKAVREEIPVPPVAEPELPDEPEEPIEEIEEAIGEEPIAEIDDLEEEPKD